MYRYSVGAAAVVLIALGSVTAVSNASAQSAGSAGAARPNLRVLQALPEAQLFSLMNLLADSLGVRCEYCHVRRSPDLAKTPSNGGGWVWDSDDKPQKRTAREMMQMVIELNASRFRGQARITCYTCHRGSPQPDRTPPLPPRADLTTSSTPRPLPSADRVWADYVSAVGEADKVSRGTVITGWDDRSEGRFWKIQITLSGRDRYRATLTTPDGLLSQGLDGDVGWTAANDRVVRVPGDDVARLRRVAMRSHAVKAERPANLRVIGVEHFSDGDVYVAVARIDAVTTRSLSFDVVTGLLRRDLTTTETLLLPLEEQVEYDDYRDVDGVKLPFRTRVSDGATYSTVTRTYTDIRFGVAVDDAVFRPPSVPR